MKISVIGYSGAGKSTLAAKLGELYSAPVLHLDTVQFLPDWQVRPLDDGRRIVYDFMQNEKKWVIDGNYGKFFRKERLEQSDMIIFMDFPRIVCLYYAFGRYLKFRGKNRPDMADGCKEKFDRDFFWWILRGGRTKERRHSYKQICVEHKAKLVRLKSRRAANSFMRTLANKTNYEEIAQYRT